MAVAHVEITNIDGVLANLNREIMGIKRRTKAGMREAALLVKGRSLRMTPVDTGNLRNSCYTEVVDDLAGPGAEIGYTAYYAPFVHEIDKNYRALGTHWKFLEIALKESGLEIIEIIKRRAKV